MILHGILASYGIFFSLLHEMNVLTENDTQRENRKINWKETQVYDNSNKGRYQNLTIYRERWR